MLVDVKGLKCFFVEINLKVQIPSHLNDIIFSLEIFSFERWMFMTNTEIEKVESAHCAQKHS